MMTLTRWNPWQEMELVRRQMDQLFNELTPVREATWTPAIELTSNDNQFVLRAQLPGIDANDLDVQVGQKAVAIAGEHKFENKTEENGYFRSEFRYGKFHRVIPLPADVQNDQVKADFKDGILTLTLPRVQVVKPSVVKVNLTEAAPQEALAPEQQPETEDAWQS
jgi:HSP20 family protein